MNVLVDSKIPFIKGMIESVPGVAKAEYIAPEEFTRERVADADALFIRTRTRCNAALLEGSKVRFIGTATIGHDHIDRQWCAEHGITTTNAPGCNAPGVAQWVFAAIAACLPDCRPEETTLGIVGVGHIGKIVERWARSIGFKVLLNDPPRAALEGPQGFVSLDEIASQADIITFHTPLTHPPHEHASYHLCNANFLSKLAKRPLLLNAARGAVVDTDALIAAHAASLTRDLCIDCWEGEPEIRKDLMDIAAIATPHIAGYSLEGKHRASAMLINSFRTWAGLPADAAIEAAVRVPNTPRSLEDISLNYNILADDAMFRNEHTAMERLRNSYNYRHEP